MAGGGSGFLGGGGLLDVRRAGSARPLPRLTHCRGVSACAFGYSVFLTWSHWSLLTRPAVLMALLTAWPAPPRSGTCLLSFFPPPFLPLSLPFYLVVPQLLNLVVTLSLGVPLKAWKTTPKP